jgi:hypothetical protein
MAGRRRSILVLCLLTSCIAPLNSASSQETVNYSYDERGRLTQVSRSGSVNNGVNACYAYDRADNRTNVTVANGDCSAVTPSFSVSDVSATEGSPLVFTVTRSGSTATAVGVNYATANGTATAGSDYNAASNTLSFAVNEVSRTISVTTIDDAAVESAEAVLVNLSGATGGATIGDGQGVGTINDNDSPPPPSFAINDVSVTEGGNLVLTVTKTGSTSSSFSVNFATANGTAAAGSDYTANSGTLTFAAADTTKTITIVTTDDAAVESAETVLVNLSGATGGATISDAQGVGTINDNDVAPTCGGVTFTIASNAAVTEGANSAFMVTKTGATSNSCGVNYATANGSATAGSDYTATSGTLTFTSAQTSHTINVATTDDAAVESAETFSMSLSLPTGGSTLGTPNSASATINDNDTPAGPSFSINDAAATEGSNVIFTITRSGLMSGSYSVSYGTSDISATGGVDYVTASGTVTFAANETTKTVPVLAASDSEVEGDETFAITLNGPTGGATIGDGDGIGTIYNYTDPGGGGEHCYDENGQEILCGPLGMAPTQTDGEEE